MGDNLRVEAPRAGAGIEILFYLRHCVQCLEAPRAGAGIEICLSAGKQGGARKPLVQGLVLKSGRSWSSRRPYEAPRAGAGIEIQICHYLISSKGEAPRAGAGIEIKGLEEDGVPEGEAPRAGAGIEI